jgi:hypothetical protein
VTLQHLGDLHADRDDRVQRRQRVLKDHRHVTAADVTQRVLAQLEQVHAVELGPAADLDTALRQQPHDRQ